MGNNESVQIFMKIVHVLDSANFDDKEDDTRA